MTDSSNRSKRLELFKRLSALLPVQLDQVILVLDPPSGLIPPSTTAQGLRVAALLQWAESPGGCGLVVIEEVIESVLASPESSDAQSLPQQNTTRGYSQGITVEQSRDSDIISGDSNIQGNQNQVLRADKINIYYESPKGSPEGLAPPSEADSLPSALPKRWLLAHPYGMPPHFTGRKAELQMLSQWLNDEAQPPLFVLRALGGFGKSALTWHWLTTRVDRQQWSRVVWWSFYEASANFETFVRVTLEYVTGRDPGGMSARQRMEALVMALQEQRVLLVMDGFERELRAYGGMGAAYQGDEIPPSPPSQGGNSFGQQSHTSASQAESTSPLCKGGLRGDPFASPLAKGGLRGDQGRDCISPLAEDFLRTIASLPNLKGKVLMSTRLRPRAVEVPPGTMLLQGCREEELTALQPEDAVAFFRSQGIRGNRGEIEQACRNYGFHPLSLRLLAGYVMQDFEFPGDIRAAERLDLTGDLVQRRNHVLARSYENLSLPGKQLLGQIACFRSPVQIRVLVDVRSQGEDAEGSPPSPALRAANTRDKGGVGRQVQAVLRELVDRGLLHFEPRTQQFDLHPIVRRYAYDRMAGTERTAAHAQLRDYFAAVPEPERVQTLDDLAPVSELYHHMVRAGQYDEAWQLFCDRLHDALYYQLGAYEVYAELLRALFPQGEDQLPQLTSENDQAWTLNSLANSYSLSGQPAKAVPLFEQTAAIYEKKGQKQYLAIALANLAYMAQLYIGALHAADANLRRSITLCQEIEDDFWEAVAHQELGRLLAYRGQWAEAEEELDKSENYFIRTNNIEWLGKNFNHRVLGALLRVRAGESESASTALSAAGRSLELAEEDARTTYPVERDFVRAYWLLGAAHRVNGTLSQSDTHLSEALTRSRTINLVEVEADILLDLVRLRADQGQPDEALRLAQESLIIADRCGYVLQGADVRLFLARRALAVGERALALGYAREARRLAECDGGEFVYRVAYDEAGALLAELSAGV